MWQKLRSHFGRKGEPLFAVRRAGYVFPVFDGDAQPLDVLLEQRHRILESIEREREQIRALENIVSGLISQLEHHEYLLGEIDSVLGRSPQIHMEDASIPLRGQRIGQVAVKVLAEERGERAEVHYTEWFDLLKLHGHIVVGKKPLNTFLTQINRSPFVEKVGRRTGRYRLSRKAA